MSNQTENQKVKTTKVDADYTLNVGWQKVTSSNVDEVAYDPENKLLYVRFTNKSIYSYDGVSQEVFDGLLTAESVGKYLNANVKPAFTHKKIA